MAIDVERRTDLFSPEFERPNASFGSYLPKNHLTNEDFERWQIKSFSGTALTVKDIQERTGIDKRYVAGPKESLLSMARKASQEAYGRNPGTIDAVIVTTNFPTGINLSTRIKEEFGFPISKLDCDIHAGCAGRGWSLDYVKKHEREFLGKRILFVATEKIHPYLQELENGANENPDGTPKDKSYGRFLFSDGAFALLTEYGPSGMEILFSKTKSPECFREEYNNTIKLPIDISLFREPYLFPVSMPYTNSGKIEQDGTKVFKVMCDVVPELVKDAIAQAKIDLSDIALFSMHQPSGRTVETVADKIARNLSGWEEKGLEDPTSPQRHVEYDKLNKLIVRDYRDGNFSSGATLKIEKKAFEDGKLKKGNKVAIIPFGAGITGAFTLLRWN